MKDTAQNQVVQYGIDQIDDLKGQNIEASDLHHHLYNGDYFVIGYALAREFINEYGYGAFDAIGKVKDYEQDNFGEVTTDLSDEEKVANMLAYILGEEALSQCPTLQNNWDGKLSDKQLDAIKKELEAQL